MDLNATTRSHRHFHSTTTFRKVNHKVHKWKALVLRFGILIHEVPVASESTAQSNEGAKTSGKRKSTKYETFPHVEERYLVNLWKENHDQLESKNACKVWNKIRACSHYAKFCLFCKKICQRETILSANDFFRPRKFCQASPNFKETVE